MRVRRSSTAPRPRGLHRLSREPRPLPSRPRLRCLRAAARRLAAAVRALLDRSVATVHHRASAAQLPPAAARRQLRDEAVPAPAPPSSTSRPELSRPPLTGWPVACSQRAPGSSCRGTTCTTSAHLSRCRCSTAVCGDASDRPDVCRYCLGREAAAPLRTTARGCCAPSRAIALLGAAAPRRAAVAVRSTADAASRENSEGGAQRALPPSRAPLLARQLGFADLLRPPLARHSRRFPRFERPPSASWCRSSASPRPLRGRPRWPRPGGGRRLGRFPAA